MRKLNVCTTFKRIPQSCNIVSSRWIFKYKKDFNGNIIKRKSRLVAHGFTQKFGIDFQDTFSPTSKNDSIRLFIFIAAQKNFNREQIDVNAAYPNSKLTWKNFHEITTWSLWL